MEYSYCEFLLHQIAFYNDVVRPCCSFSIDKKKLFSQKYNGDLDGIENYFKVRESYINMFRKGIEPPCAEGCTTYQKIVSSDSAFKLNHLVISHRSYCSCNCIYCEQTTFGKDEVRQELNKKKSYDIKPILKYLRDNNLIEKECRFLVCGGECTEYPKAELAFLLYFATMTDCCILLLSSGLNYSEEIASILKTPNSILKISVDSGTRSTFKKIKRVDAHSKVWKNIKNYIDITKKYNNRYTYVELKYIIIPGVNDTIKEAKAFIKQCKKVKCGYVRIDVEHSWIDKNKNNPSVHEPVKKVINYFFDTLYDDKDIKIEFEGVEKEFLFTFVKEEYRIPQIGR